MSGSFLGDLGYELLIGVLAALILGGLGFAWRFKLVDRVRARRQWREFERLAPQIVVETVSYMTHLRDVGGTFLRAQTDDPSRIRERIRRDILEPIRGFLTSPPGGEIKVVWFRPEAGGTDLAMYEQVGHSPEGQRALRLTIGVGKSMAGEAFVQGEPVWSNQCETESSFQEVEKSKATGSLACVPVKQAGEVTGVLSVLATWPGAFWHPEIAYFSVLASAIGALEPLESAGNSTEAPK